MKKLLLIPFLILLFAACQKKDINALKNEVTDLKSRVTRLEDAAKIVNTDIASLKSIATALQGKISVVSYTSTATGYELTMSDGSKINLSNGKDGANGTNGKDGVNAPVIGLKQDADGNYYWTIGSDWLLQNGQKVKANGIDGADGTNGTNGISPLLMVNATSNQWMVSYDNGNTWQVIKDGNGNPIAATGAQGPQGPQGQPGQNGIPGFNISETEAAIIITYGSNTYTLPKGGGDPNQYVMYMQTSVGVGGRITMLINADLQDRPDIWIDLNNNKQREERENVTIFNTLVQYTTGSNTLAIYGKVTTLNCSGITALDLSKNTVLADLNCSGNALASLDLSKNTALTNLNCSGNALASLDLSKNTALTNLNCTGNQHLASLDLSKNIQLETLFICNTNGFISNALRSLDLSKNTKLKQLRLEDNFISSLDLSNNKELQEIRFHFLSDLSSLILPKSDKLQKLYLLGSPITSLDVSGNTGLQELFCQMLNITSLDISQNSALTYLVCWQLPLSSASKTALINNLPYSGNFKNAGIIGLSQEEFNSAPVIAALNTAKTNKWKIFGGLAQSVGFDNEGTQIETELDWLLNP